MPVTELRLERQGATVQRWWADVSLMLVALIWGINIPVMKYSIGRMDEFLFNALRLTFSAATLIVVVVVQKRRRRNPVRPREYDTNPAVDRKRRWFGILWFSFLVGFVYQICFLLGINSTTAGNTALIMSAVPVWTAIFAFLLLREKLSAGAWAGMLVALAGVLVVTFCKPATVDSISSGSLFGNLVVSLAAFAWALASVLSRPLMKSVSPLDLACCSVVLTLPLHYLVAWKALPEVGAALSDPILLTAIIFSGVFSTGFASAMWNFGVQHLGAAHAAGFQNLVPLVALAASWILINEVPFALQLAGGGLIIAGLLIMRRRR